MENKEKPEQKEHDKKSIDPTTIIPKPKKPDDSDNKGENESIPKEDVKEPSNK